jgi:hypothetical protein
LPVCVWKLRKSRVDWICVSVQEQGQELNNLCERMREGKEREVAKRRKQRIG